MLTQIFFEIWIFVFVSSLILKAMLCEYKIYTCTYDLCNILPALIINKSVFLSFWEIFSIMLLIMLFAIKAL